MPFQNLFTRLLFPSLKPENVVIDSQGYLRLTDFGFAKRDIVDNKGAFSICGTPEYYPPEMLLKLGHGKSADWWSVGCLAYELMSGWPPFYSKERSDMFNKIKHEEPKYSKSMSANCRKFLEALFDKDPETRLGTSGFSAIKNHAWFSNFDWTDLMRKDMVCPFSPNLKEETDIQYFDKVNKLF